MGKDWLRGLNYAVGFMYEFAFITIGTMFRRSRRAGSKDEQQSNRLTLPPLEELEQWVLTLIIKLGLQPGTFTFIPAYGGVLLFVKDQGITWIPFKEIKEAMGEVDKGKLVENASILGGVAALGAAHVIVLPALLVPKLIKGSYRVIANPSPYNSMSFLKSMIDRVIIEDKELKRGLLGIFELDPYKSDTPNVDTFMITVQRRFFDSTERPKFLTVMRNFVFGNRDPVFAVPSDYDKIHKFAEILKTHGIEVRLSLKEIQYKEEQD